MDADEFRKMVSRPTRNNRIDALVPILVENPAAIEILFELEAQGFKFNYQTVEMLKEKCREYLIASHKKQTRKCLKYFKI